MVLGNQDIQLMRNVLADISHLRDQSGPEATDDQLRRLSVTLRNLLNDDQLARCWKLLGLTPKQMTIVAPRLQTNYLNKDSFAVALGGQINSSQVFNMTHLPGVTLTDEQLREASRVDVNETEHSFTLNDFKNSPAIYMAGVNALRFHVVAFVANKLGGAHLDFSRKKDETIYKALDDAAMLAQLGRETRADGTERSGKDVVYSVLISIAQRIAASADVIRLEEALARELTP